jgi:hypothetical protein
MLLDAWMMLTIVLQADWPSAERDAMVRRQAELDVACIQTAASMLDKLRLQPLDGSTGSDSPLAISRLFTKYLNFFVAALEKAALLEVCISLIQFLFFLRLYRMPWRTPPQIAVNNPERTPKLKGASVK